MIIGVTETLDSLRCMRKWDFSSPNRQNLENIVPKSPALPLGTVLHEALKAWTLHPEADLVDFYKLAAIAENKKIVDAYTAKVGMAPSSDELSKVHDALLMGESMMANYQAHWKAPLPEDFELVSPEQEVRVPIPGTDHVPDELHAYEPRDVDHHCKWCGVALVDHGQPQPHYLRGRLDGIIIDTRSGLLYDMDHKSYSNRPRIETLQSNQQFIMYHWMLTQLGIGPIGGVAYDGMWKRAAPPKLLERKDLFLRLRVEHTPRQLAECAEMLAIFANQLANKPGITMYRAWDGSCEWGCSFTELCLAVSRGDDWQYIKERNYGPRPSYEETVPNRDS